MRIVLISPKGPLYRRRGGIFKQTLRYMPLTLPTLASLVPDELYAEIVCVDEAIEDIDPELRADLVGMTVITGTAPRTYELSARLRSRGIPVVLGGPHVTLVPDDAQPHADSIVVGRLQPRPHEIALHAGAGAGSRESTAAEPNPPAATEIPDRRRLRGDSRLHPQLRFLCRAFGLG
jgi:radical SAM superfamily enzyme YgiQ (UPF0313 family)